MNTKMNKLKLPRKEAEMAQVGPLTHMRKVHMHMVEKRVNPELSYDSKCTD